MAESDPPRPPAAETPLGLAGILEEDVEYSRLLGRVHRSIERRELSGQAIDFAAVGLASVLIEYVRALFAALGGRKGTRRLE